MGKRKKTSNELQKGMPPAQPPTVDVNVMQDESHSSANVSSSQTPQLSTSTDSSQTATNAAQFQDSYPGVLPGRDLQPKSEIAVSSSEPKHTQYAENGSTVDSIKKDGQTVNNINTTEVSTLILSTEAKAAVNQTVNAPQCSMSENKVKVDEAIENPNNTSEANKNKDEIMENALTAVSSNFEKILPLLENVETENTPKLANMSIPQESETITQAASSVTDQQKPEIMGFEKPSASSNLTLAENLKHDLSYSKNIVKSENLSPSEISLPEFNLTELQKPGTKSYLSSNNEPLLFEMYVPNTDVSDTLKMDKIFQIGNQEDPLTDNKEGKERTQELTSNNFSLKEKDTKIENTTINQKQGVREIAGSSKQTMDEQNPTVSQGNVQTQVTEEEKDQNNILHITGNKKDIGNNKDDLSPQNVVSGKPPNKKIDNKANLPEAPIKNITDIKSEISNEIQLKTTASPLSSVKSTERDILESASKVDIKTGKDIPSLASAAGEVENLKSPPSFILPLGKPHIPEGGFSPTTLYFIEDGVDPMPSFLGNLSVTKIQDSLQSSLSSKVESASNVSLTGKSTIDSKNYMEKNETSTTKPCDRKINNLEQKSEEKDNVAGEKEIQLKTETNYSFPNSSPATNSNKKETLPTKKCSNESLKDLDVSKSKKVDNSITAAEAITIGDNQHDTKESESSVANSQGAGTILPVKEMELSSGPKNDKVQESVEKRQKQGIQGEIKKTKTKDKTFELKNVPQKSSIPSDGIAKGASAISEQHDLQGKAKIAEREKIRDKKPELRTDARKSLIYSEAVQKGVSDISKEKYFEGETKKAESDKTKDKKPESKITAQKPLVSSETVTKEASAISKEQDSQEESKKAETAKFKDKKAELKITAQKSSLSSEAITKGASVISNQQDSLGELKKGEADKTKDKKPELKTAAQKSLKPFEAVAKRASAESKQQESQGETKKSGLVKIKDKKPESKITAQKSPLSSELVAKGASAINKEQDSQGETKKLEIDNMKDKKPESRSATQKSSEPAAKGASVISGLTAVKDGKEDKNIGSKKAKSKQKSLNEQTQTVSGPDESNSKFTASVENDVSTLDIKGTETQGKSGLLDLMQEVIEVMGKNNESKEKLDTIETDCENEPKNQSKSKNKKKSKTKESIKAQNSGSNLAKPLEDTKKMQNTKIKQEFKVVDGENKNDVQKIRNETSSKSDDSEKNISKSKKGKRNAGKSKEDSKQPTEKTKQDNTRSKTNQPSTAEFINGTTAIAEEQDIGLAPINDTEDGQMVQETSQTKKKRKRRKNKNKLSGDKVDENNENQTSASLIDELGGVKKKLQ